MPGVIRKEPLEGRCTILKNPPGAVCMCVCELCAISPLLFLIISPGLSGASEAAQDPFTSTGTMEEADGGPSGRRVVVVGGGLVRQRPSSRPASPLSRRPARLS